MNEPNFEIITEEAKGDYGRFVITPLPEGYGHTLGNSIRRVLLGSLYGAAITSVKISSVKHQFSSLKGMKEDVVEFLLNLKKVRFSFDKDISEIKANKPFRASISVKSAGEVKAKDIKVESPLKIANPDFVLAMLNKNASLNADLEVEIGAGYLPSKDRSSSEVGLIPLDAAFSPVVKVNYRIEETRVGRFTNYDKLVLEIWTDSTLSAKDALTTSAKILVSYFDQVVNPKKVVKEVKKSNLNDTKPEMKLSVEEIGLPTRISNALIKAGYETVADLISANKDDLVKVRNLGEKSLKIIAAALGSKGVDF